MRSKPILSAVVVLTAAYVAYPYFAIYRIGEALRGGDRSALAAMVAWDRVRDGLTEDICNEIDGKPAQPADAASAGTELPPFGSSFVRGIASTAVDANVTPETLAQMVRPRDVPPDRKAAATRAAALPGARIVWAFFDGPTRFTLWVRTAAEAAGEPPVKLRMDLVGGTWKITRVWLPRSLLRHGAITDIAG